MKFLWIWTPTPIHVYWERGALKYKIGIVMSMYPAGTQRMGRVYAKKILGSMAYDHPQSGRVYIFIFHQFIHINYLDHPMLCPIQFRVNSVEVNGMPKFLLKRSTDTSHAIVVDDTDGDTPMIVTISINGVTSHFPCRK